MGALRPRNPFLLCFITEPVELIPCNNPTAKTSRVIWPVSNDESNQDYLGAPEGIANGKRAVVAAGSGGACGNSSANPELSGFDRTCITS